MPVPAERCFTFNGFSYAAQLWGEAGDLPVIALHGWLDNAASFSVLAPRLTGVKCLAIDLAGHGASDHLPGFTDYPVWSEIAAIYAIADAMGWQRFAVMGHSRGAMMAVLTASLYPERISQVILLDALMPPSVEPAQAAERMQAGIDEIRFRLQREQSLYASYEDAIRARCQSRHGVVTSQTAEILATRGLREVDQQYHWHADGKLWASSLVALTEEMMNNYIAKITEEHVPVLLLLGEEGYIKRQESTSKFRRHCEQVITALSITVEVFDDGHYLHMEKAVDDVAKSITGFMRV